MTPVPLLLDGLYIFHNPFAEYPISWHFFDRDDITHHDFDLETGVPLVKTHDGALFQRSTFKLNIPTRKMNLKLQKKHVKTDQPLSIRDLEDIFGPL